MAEITWYILDDLDKFICFLKAEMPNTLLIHLLMTYRTSENKNMGRISSQIWQKLRDTLG